MQIFHLRGWFGHRRAGCRRCAGFLLFRFALLLRHCGSAEQRRCEQRNQCLHDFTPRAQDNKSPRPALYGLETRSTRLLTSLPIPYGWDCRWHLYWGQAEKWITASAKRTQKMPISIGEV